MVVITEMGLRGPFDISDSMLLLCNREAKGIFKNILLQEKYLEPCHEVKHRGLATLESSKS